MHHFVYIIYSKSSDKYYKGFTKNVKRRLKQHNCGESQYTKSGVPWSLILSLKKETKYQAIVLEQKVKNLNRERLQNFIRKYKSFHDVG